MDEWGVPEHEDFGEGAYDVSEAYDVGEAFGEHNIEYWVYDGRRLIPASPDEQERLREWAQRSRLEMWKAEERRRERAQAWRQPWITATQRLAAFAPWLHAGQRKGMATPAGELPPTSKGDVSQPERPIRRVIDRSES